MFKNLLEYESGVECYIQYIETVTLENRFALVGLKRDDAIVKKPDDETGETIIISFYDGDLIIKKEIASLIFVRSCEVCWSCGNCGLKKELEIAL